MPKSRVGTFISNPVLDWLGKNSLGLFLWQYPVIYLFSYFHATKWFLAPLWEIVLILSLTIASRKILSLRSWKTKKSARQLACIVLGLLCLAGGYGIIASQNSKMNDQEELAAKLKENEEKINTTNTTQTSTASTLDQTDY